MLTKQELEFCKLREHFQKKRNSFISYWLSLFTFSESIRVATVSFERNVCDWIPSGCDEWHAYKKDRKIWPPFVDKMERCFYLLFLFGDLEIALTSVNAAAAATAFENNDRWVTVRLLSAHWVFGSFKRQWTDGKVLNIHEMTFPLKKSNDFHVRKISILSVH